MKQLEQYGNFGIIYEQERHKLQDGTKIMISCVLDSVNDQKNMPRLIYEINNSASVFDFVFVSIFEYLRHSENSHLVREVIASDSRSNNWPVSKELARKPLMDFICDLCKKTKIDRSKKDPESMRNNRKTLTLIGSVFVCIDCAVRLKYASVEGLSLVSCLNCGNQKLGLNLGAGELCQECGMICFNLLQAHKSQQ